MVYAQALDLIDDEKLIREYEDYHRMFGQMF